jgi:hypothetical protein
MSVAQAAAAGTNLPAHAGAQEAAAEETAGTASGCLHHFICSRGMIASAAFESNTQANSRFLHSCDT